MKTLALRTAMIVAAVLTAATFTTTTAAAQEQPAAVKARILNEDTLIVPGQTFQLKVEFEIAPGTHIYYKDPGEAGLPTEIELVSPESLSLVELGWQPAHSFETDGIKGQGYEQRTEIAVLLKAANSLKAGEQVTIRLHASWLACNTSCTPGESELTITLPVTAAKTATVAAQKPAISFLWALLLAFGGGVLLNLMPCVLPVISLKIFGFVKQAGQDRRQIFRLGLAYSAGTIATFLLLGLVVIGAQMAGYSVGWGFQFQQPLFVFGMITLVTVMSLSLFGVFYLQVGTGNGLERQAQSEGPFGAFCKGVSATLLSTPCTAPLLGTAMGFAFSQPWWGVLTIFFTVGLGLSSPYLLLSWQPGWMRFLPKPGAWMEHFKQAMGFLMLATGIWLLSVLGQQAGLDAVLITLVFLLVVSAGAWTVGHFAGLEFSTARRRTVKTAVLIVCAATFWYAVLPAFSASKIAASAASSSNQWEPYSKQSLQKHLAAGKIVLIDFTADWCLTCKLNERVLRDPTVTAKLLATNTVILKADWTKGNQEITQLLAEFGRSGVPLYVLYAPDKPESPLVLPEIITVTTIVETLDNLARDKQ
ncbi:MAG: thioredoxin family protein [Candidatus Obscuribacterales bacterium]|nr:thioredoxin family protein [Candidatus Obscuribacterales bacterium]